MRILLAAVLLLAPSALCQTAPPKASPGTLIREALQHFNANKKKAYAYTYVELWHNQNFSKHGKLKSDQRAKFDSVLIEDLPYLRKIEENGKPLTGKAARKEEEKYEAAVKARRGMTLAQKQAELRVRNFNFPFELSLLPTLYSNRIVGVEVLNGRPAIHIDCVPRTGVKPKNPAEAEALNEHLQIWIDAQDEIFSRFDGELLAPVNGLRTGTEASFSFTRIEGVWLPLRTTIRGQVKRGWFVIGVKTELTYSDFQKFRVDVRVLDSNNREISAER